MMQCESCAYIIHPPSPVCRRCRCRALTWRPILGTGRLFGHGINRVDWGRGLPTFVVGIVDMDVQPGLRLFTRIVGCREDEVRVGLSVEVRFERLPDDPADGDAGPIYLPVFAPMTADAP